MDETARRRRGARSASIIACLLLVLSALSVGVYKAHELTLDLLSRSLSARAGTQVRVGGLRGALGPGLRPVIIIEKITVGGAYPVLTVQRAEADLELRLGSRPKIRSVRLVRPVLRITREHWREWERPLPHPGLPVRRSAASVRAAGTADLVIVDGSIRAEIPVGETIYTVRSRGIYLRRTSAHEAVKRLVLGQTTISSGEHDLIDLSASSVDLEPVQRGFRPTRAAVLGGTLASPAGPRLILLAAKLEESLEGYWLRIEGKPSGRSSGRFTLTSQLDRSFRPTGARAARLVLQNVALSSFEPLLAAAGAKVGDTRLNGQVSVEQQAGSLRLNAALGVASLRLRHPLLSSSTVGPFDGKLTGEVTVAPEQGTLQIHRLALGTGAVELNLAGKIDLAPTRTAVALDLTMPTTPCQQILSSLPRRFAPKLRGMALDGDLGLEAHLRLDTDDMEQVEVGLDLSPLKCRVLFDPPGADVKTLKQELAITVSGPRGVGQRWVLGPSNPDFQRFSRISKQIKAAFIVAEDGQFYLHDGFDKRQLARAFASNLQEKRIRRGASTISQQVVKNVFLSHERTLARKFQEAVLTWRMEQLIPKKRILELYLNLVEMGPGIYGVGQATRHYFGRTPRKVTPLQAAHLAALTPSPRHLGQRFRHGDAPGPAWREKLSMLLRMMRRRGTISREEQKRWSAAQLMLQP